jgi:hypothetical protein
MIDILERLRFDVARCEAIFSKGIATNIEEAAEQIERMRAALKAVDALWGHDALNFAQEMEMGSPVGEVWAQVRNALGQLGGPTDGR